MYENVPFELRLPSVPWMGPDMSDAERELPSGSQSLATSGVPWVVTVSVVLSGVLYQGSDTATGAPLSTTRGSNRSIRLSLARQPPSAGRSQSTLAASPQFADPAPYVSLLPHGSTLSCPIPEWKNQFRQMPGKQSANDPTPGSARRYETFWERSTSPQRCAQ